MSRSSSSIATSEHLPPFPSSPCPPGHYPRRSDGLPPRAMGGFISSFLCNLVGIAFPAFASFKSLEAKNEEEDSFWLMYWVVFGVFSLFESIADSFIFWFPFYFEIKLACLIALQIPQLKLSSTIYKSYIQPYFKQHEKGIDSIGEEVLDEVNQKTKKLVKEEINSTINSAEKTQ